MSPRAVWRGKEEEEEDEEKEGGAAAAQGVHLSSTWEGPRF